MSRTALVTGGAGFLGFHLCASLIQDGFGVVCVDDLSTGSMRNAEDLRALSRQAGTKFHFLPANVATSAMLDLRLERLDAIYHFAATASPKKYQSIPLHTIRTGIYGTDNAAYLARRYGARLVFASTSEVYGSPAEHPQREEYWGSVNPIGPRSMYDESKRAAEALLMAHRREDPDFDVRIARIFNTYGPRMAPDDGRLVPAFVTQALAGRPLTVFGDGKQTRSLCYVSDLIRGIRVLGDVDRSQLHSPPVYNVGNPDERTVVEIADVIREVVGSDSDIRHLPLPVDDPPQRCPAVFYLIMLGWGPHMDLEDGLRLTVEWFWKECRG